MLKKIKNWWRWDGRYYHRDFVRGIKSLIRWFPVIWKDRDWDDSFIWRIMIQKLKFQSKYIGGRDIHTSAKRDAEIMMTCVRLMEKVSEEFYTMEYMDYEHSEFNWVDSHIPGHKKLDVVEKSENFDKYFKKYPLVYKKIKQKYPKKSKGYIAMHIAIENHNRAKRLLFDIMRDNIQGWWD